MQDWFNIQQPVNVINIQYQWNKKQNHMILSLGTGKAFDKTQILMEDGKEIS